MMTVYIYSKKVLQLYWADHDYVVHDDSIKLFFFF